MSKKQQQPRLKDIWYGHDEKRFTAIPLSLWDHAVQWKLTQNEYIVLLALLRYKWTADHPRPAVASIARYALVGERHARRAVEKLEERGLLKRIKRTKGSQRPNEYDLSPLFEKLKRAAADKPISEADIEEFIREFGDGPKEQVA